MIKNLINKKYCIKFSIVHLKNKSKFNNILTNKLIKKFIFNNLI